MSDTVAASEGLVFPRETMDIRVKIAFRMVQWCTLAALTWKLGAFIEIVKCYYRLPLYQEFFPSLLQSPTLLAVTYIVMVAALAITALTNVRVLRIIAAAVVWISATIACLHQGSHNDMTFATAWWTSLWSLWLACQMERKPGVEPELQLRRAALLSRCIVSMILLGGAVGKWTSEYWSGQVLYEIYFIDRDFWVFNRLRESFDQEGLRTVAMWYSRKVIVVETLCGFGLWMLPPRWAAGIAVTVLTSIALFSNFNLFSVLLSLIGLAATGFFVPGRPRTP